MAAFSHTRIGSRSSVLNGGIYGDQELPSGSCNYRDLSIGTRAPVCGCQRFYLNATHLAHEATGERVWCFCGHHACFHDAFSQQQKTQEQDLVTSQGGVPVEPVVDYHRYDGDGLAAQVATGSPSKAPTGLGIRHSSRSQSQSINTRVWQALNEFARNQEDGGVSDTTSKLPSTAAPSVIDDGAGAGHMGQQHLPGYRSMGPPVNIPPASMPRVAEDYSATEVATPSIAGTPDFRAFATPSSHARTSPAQLQPVRDNFQPHLAHTQSRQIEIPAQPLDSTPEQAPVQVETSHSLRDLQGLMRTYSRRLEALESLSFSHVTAEDIQDRFDLFDGRVLDLEHWRNDQEKERTSPLLPTSSSSKRRRLLPNDPGSFASDASFDSNAAAHTEAAVLATLAANAETHPRIDALESRVEDLENASLPSFARPWQVQVVLLPWSRELRGIWFSAEDATQHSLRSTTQASEEWTGAQAGPTLSFKSSVDGSWTTESIQAWANEAKQWLSPKACGPGGVVFQRLASRGFVQDVTFSASDATHILQAIHTAFGDISMTASELPSEQMARFRGLQERFVPLRKVRKSSRLRFLKPAEMVTSAVWTAGFLDSGVFMKSNNGQRRLYITTPGAYIQPSEDSPLTWTYIRELSGRQSQDPTTEETCWTYHENVDRPPSVHSSSVFRDSQWSAQSQVIVEQEEEAQGTTAPPLSPWSEARTSHQRTVSLPVSATASDLMPASAPQRRVASFGATVTKHTYDDEANVEVAVKRRRLSMSPEAERRGVNFTPRWSREPPSPFTSEAAVERQSQDNGSRRRGTTPFAYATPHSNSNYVGRFDFVPGDGDTEVNTDIIGPNSDHGEEEWEGVDDDGNTANIDGHERELESDAGETG